MVFPDYKKEPVPSMDFELPPINLEEITSIDLEDIPDVEFITPEVDFDFPDITQKGDL